MNRWNAKNKHQLFFKDYIWPVKDNWLYQMHYINDGFNNVFRVGPHEGRQNLLRLDMNENPEGLPEDFVKKVLTKVTPEFLATYPEPTKFIQAFAKMEGLDADYVVATNGSDMAIRYILEAFVRKGKVVVGVTPSFEMYRVDCEMLELVYRGIGYNSDLTMSSEAILDAIDDDVDLVVLLNPNNPIGNVYTEDEVRKIIVKASKFNASVIIDEAYHYFYKGTYIDFASEYDNVIVLRTFSKLCSIAACRLGVAISNPNNIRVIKNAMPTFDTNSVALLFGEAIVNEPGLIDNLIKIEAEGRKYVVSKLHDAGYSTHGDNGNYVFIKPNRDPVELATDLKSKGILVKTYGYESLKDYIRITTGSKGTMDCFLKVFLEVDKVTL